MPSSCWLHLSHYQCVHLACVRVSSVSMYPLSASQHKHQQCRLLFPLCFLGSFLPFTVRESPFHWRVLNMPPFPHESHCLLSSLKTSSSVPLQHRHPSHSALALLSLTFTGRPFCTFSLLVHLQWLHAALETVHEVDQGIKLPPYSLKKLSAISAFLCNCTYSPSQPSPFSFSPLHAAFIF